MSIVKTKNSIKGLKPGGHWELCDHSHDIKRKRRWYGVAQVAIIPSSPEIFLPLWELGSFTEVLVQNRSYSSNTVPA